MRNNIIGTELGQLVRHRVEPAQRLEVLEVLVVRQLLWKCDLLVVAHLRHEHDARQSVFEENDCCSY